MPGNASIPTAKRCEDRGMTFAILLALMVAYVTYRLSLSRRSIRAQRAGDFDRAGELSARGFALMMGTGVGVVVVAVVLIWIAK